MEKAHHSNLESDSDELSSDTEEKRLEANSVTPNQAKNSGLCSARIGGLRRSICEGVVSLQFKVLVVIVSVLILLGASCISSNYLTPATHWGRGTTSVIGTELDELLKYLRFLKQEYGHQDLKLWKVIESQIADYLNGSKAPLTIVLVYEEADKTAKLLASEVSRKAVELKHNTDFCGDSDSSKIEGTASAMRKGLLEDKLPSISLCKKLLIYNVEDLRPTDAADLHSLLDPDYPNVESAVYVFTVKANTESDRSIYYTVDKLLKERWGKELDADKLEPLLSRLENFVKVVPEPQLELR